MPTIHLKKKVKAELDNLIEKELMKEAKANPQVLIRAIKTKYGYTHSAFIERLIRNFKRK